MALGALFKGNQIDQRFSWSFFGVMLSVGFGLFGIYTAFFYEKKPRLVVQQLSSSPVLSVRENVSKLDIVFDGEDIRKKNQTLTLVTLRLANLGNADILKSSFDDNHLPSVALPSTKIIQADVTNSSDQYLQDAVKLTILDETSFSITPAIIESNQFFDIKLILLHDVANTPHVELKGKIAGVAKIEFVNSADIVASKGYIADTFGGGVAVQFGRSFFYFLVTLVVIIGLAVVSDKLANALKQARRRSVVNKFKIGSGLAFSKQDDEVFNEYVTQGELFLVRVSQLLNDEEKLAQLITQPKEDASVRENQEEEFRFELAMAGHPFDRTVIDFLLSKQIVNTVEGRCTIDSVCKKNITQLVTTLSILAPREMKHIRASQESFGSDSKQISNVDSLPLTKAPGESSKP